MPVVNHKVYLYKPDGTTFLGELIVDNLKADIKLQDISTVTFRIPEIINGQVNPRVDEVLDSYIIELWYGKVDGVYANGDFEKIKFRIYSTPLEFADYQYLHSYAGYSIESDLEFKQIISWPGIQVKDFFRTITYNNNAATPRFTETGFTYTISTSSNTSGTKYITIGATDEPTALDIFIYEQRSNSANNSESEVSLIELTAGGVNSNDFKAGYYYLNKTGDIVNSVAIALPDNYTTFNGSATAALSYKFYDNPVARAFAVGIKTNTDTPLSNMYLDLAQDAAEGDPAEYEGYTFTTQSIYSKNGLKLNDILTGADTASDGILYNTGFTVGTISNTIAAKYRSNIDFNNITVYQAIKDIAESFEAIAVFNTVNKTVSFYAENEYGSNNGLVIKYATYLKSINKEIDAAKIITNARSLGKNNIKISLVNPTGLEIWEDYSYFLDDYHISNTTGFTITADETTGLDITFPDTSAYLSRWMDAAEALKVAKWQYTRDYFHTVFSNHNATVVDSSHNTYKGLYLKRSEAINLYVKYETQYEKKKADEYKYFYLLEHYRDLYENKGTNLSQYQYYQTKYNTAVAQAAAFKSTILDAAYDNIYDTTSVGSLAYKFAAVQSFLDKDAWEIDLDKLRTFQREAVHNDSKVDNEEDLVEATKIYVDENKEPRVTFNISIIDVLEAQEAYQDWDKFVTGDKIYIYFPEFNIDLEAQIREISIDFQSKTLSVVISTVRNYNRSFGSYLTKNIRRFHNANMNTVMYYKDGTDASIAQTETVRTTLDTGINAGDTSVNTGAVDSSTGQSSTTTDGEGQKSRVVTGVDLYTETLTLGAFTTGVKINDGRLLTFKPFDVSGTQWVQEVEVSAENGFVIRRVYGDNTVTKLAYIDATDGSAYFAGWELEPGQFSAGSTSSFVAINSQTPTSGNSLYAFWAGNETASSAPFSVTKAGAISAKEGSIAGLTMTEVSGTVKLYAGTGTWNNNNTPFYLDSTGKFSLEDQISWDPATDTLNIAGGISAQYGEIGGWTVDAKRLYAGSTTTRVELNADPLTSYAIFAGNETAASAPFSVTKSGALVATSATITGAINATSGTFNNTITIGTDTNKISIVGAATAAGTKIFSGTGTYNNANTGFYLDAAGKFSLGDQLYWDGAGNLQILGNLVADTGTIGGFTITDDTIQQGADTTKLALQSDGTNPFITIGQATNGYNQLGIFLGFDSTVAKLSLKSSTNSLLWDGTNLTINGGGTFSGTLSAATGSFTGSIAIGAGDSIFKADSNGIYLGDADFADAEFSVTPAGVLKSTSGTIGGWTLNTDAIFTGTKTATGNFTSTAGHITIGSDGHISTKNFRIDADGNAVFSGELSAATGSFGNTTINGSSTLTIGTYESGVSGDIKLSNTNGIVARNSANTTTFSVSTSGALLATDATITGSITSTSGSIGGWNIDSDNLNSNGVTLYSGSAPYISIDQDTDGYNEDGIFIGIDSSNPKLSLKGASSTLAFDGSALSITGGSLTVGTNGASTGSVVVDGDGVYGYYDGSATPTFKLSNSTGRLEAVDIYLESGNKTAEIGNLTSSIAGDFGFEITNNSGYYIDKTDIAFTASTKTISSSTTDLSVYKKGNKITVSDSVSNDGNYTVASNGTSTSLVVVETLVNESAGATLNLTRAQPYKVSVTDEGFFILTVDSLSVADKAMSVEYDSNRVWAKRLLISDLEDEETASVVIGTIAASTNFDTSATYGVITKSGDNTVYMTGQGFKIVQDGDITFKVETNGTITAETLIIRGTSTLGGWTVGDTSFESNNYSYTSGNFSTAGIKFNNNGTIIGKEFSVDSDGNAYFKGDLTAASGTFGIVEANKGNVLLGGSDPLIVRNNTTEILKLTNAGVLSVSGFTASSSAIYTGTKSTFASNDAGVYLASDGIALGTNSPFKVTSAGVLTASSGTVGGWTLDATSLTGGNAILASSGNLTLGTSDDVVRLSADDATYRLWAGAATAASAPFRVDKDGNLVATAATITGAVTATSGSFTGTINANAGSFTSSVSVGSGATSGTINVGTDTKKIVIAGTNDDETTKIYSGTGTYNNSNTGFYLDASGRFSLGNQLYWDGTTLTILGDIQADTGTIGGFSVGADYIRAADVNTKLLLKHNANTPYLSIGQSTNEYDAAGIFLGIVSDGELTPSYNPQFSIKGTGLDPNYLKWDGQDLLLKGNLSGEISAINIDNVTIDANGIRAQIDGSSPAVYSFYLNADDGKGGIAGWEIDSNNITSETNAVQLQKEGKILVGGSTVDINGDVNNATLIIDGTASGSSPVLDHANFELRANGDAIFSGALSAATGSFGDTTINGSSTLTIGTYSSGVSGDIKISNTNGIVARDSLNTTTFSVNTSGNLTATSGTVGGFTLGSSTLTAGATTTTVGISTGATTSDVAFYAGNATATSAPFRVTNAGALTSTSGSIGGWTINSDGIFTGTFDESGYTETGITISNNGSIHSQNFYLDSTGITSKAGNIGGFTIGATSLTAGAAGTSVGVTTDAVAFYAGNATPGSAPFRVTNAGVLNATGATISGAITATSGTFTGTVNANAGNFTSTVTVGSGSTTGTLKIGTNATAISLVGTDATTTTAIYSGTTGFGTGTGFYMDASGRFSLADKLSWNGSALSVVGDIGGTIGTITVGQIVISSTGINTTTNKFSVDSSTGLLTAVDGNFSGTITSTSGNIGGWTLSGSSLFAGTGSNRVGVSSGSIPFYAGAENATSAPFRVTNAGVLTASNANITGTIQASAGNIGNFLLTVTGDSLGSGFLKTGGATNRMYLKDDGISFYDTGFVNTSVLSKTQLAIGDEVGPATPGTTYYKFSNILAASTFSIQSEGYLQLHSFNNNYVYASRNTLSTASTARVLVGTSGVSTKIVKTNIEDLDYNKVDNFLDLIQPKKFINIMKNKEKISLIIEDEEDRNIPFQEMLFKREDRLYKFEQLPEYLLPYENNVEVIQKEYNKNGEISHYYFSPKVIDEQTMQGIILASLKHHQNKMKLLEEENKILKEEIALIKEKLGM